MCRKGKWGIELFLRKPGETILKNSLTLSPQKEHLSISPSNLLQWNWLFITLQRDALLLAVAPILANPDVLAWGSCLSGDPDWPFQGTRLSHKSYHYSWFTQAGDITAFPEEFSPFLFWFSKGTLELQTRHMQILIAALQTHIFSSRSKSRAKKYDQL